MEGNGELDVFLLRIVETQLTLLCDHISSIRRTNLLPIFPLALHRQLEFDLNATTTRRVRLCPLLLANISRRFLLLPIWNPASKLIITLSPSNSSDRTELLPSPLIDTRPTRLAPPSLEPASFTTKSSASYWRRHSTLPWGRR